MNSTTTRLIIAALLLAIALGSDLSDSFGINRPNPPRNFRVQPLAFGPCDQTSNGSLADTQAKHDIMSDGQTLCLPANQTNDWNGTLTISRGITLRGLGGSESCNYASSSTVVRDNRNPRNVGALIVWNVVAPKAWRMSGIRFLNGPSVGGQAVNAPGGIIFVGGNSQAMQIDNNQFNFFAPPGIPGSGVVNLMINVDTWGVLYCNDFIGVFGNDISVHASNGRNWKGVGDFGDNSWATDSNYSSSEFVFLEDNRFRDKANTDGEMGCRWQYRKNTFLNSRIPIHGTDSTTRARGCRNNVILRNDFNDNPATAAWAVQFRSGTGIVIENTTSGFGGNGDLSHIDIFRAGGFSGGPWGLCNGSDPYDENFSSGGNPAGYHCLDQAGTGKGDLFPNTANPSFWPHQTIEPIYSIKNTGDFSNELRGVTGVGGYVVANRDAYTYVGLAVAAGGPFNGTVGTGSGTLAQRPATCSVGTNPHSGATVTGVAYWATDQGTWNQSGDGRGNGVMYVCSAPNTWTEYFRPIQYPHPLRTPGGGGGGGSVSAFPPTLSQALTGLAPRLGLGIRPGGAVRGN